jgi:hypothetical protein
VLTAPQYVLTQMATSQLAGFGTAEPITSHILNGV